MRPGSRAEGDAAWRRRLRALRRWVHQSRRPLTLDTDPGSVGDSRGSRLAPGTRLPIGWCRLQGHLAARIGFCGVLRVGFLAAGEPQPRHVAEIPLTRCGRFEVRVYLPTWCVDLQWTAQGRVGDADPGKNLMDAELASTAESAEVHLLSIQYLGTWATLHLVLSDALRLRPLLHWMWWFSTQRWRRPRSLGDAARVRAYAAFCARVEADPPSVAAAVDTHLQRLPLHPGFAIVLDAVGADGAAVQDSIDACVAQAWPYWHLEILGATIPRDAPPLRVGPRVRQHDAGTDLAALIDTLPGRYLLHLRAGDRLTPLALYALAVAGLQAPEAVLLYADEDRLDPSGQRCRPRLKSRWNPELLESHDYVGVPAALCLRRVRDVGGWRAGHGSAAGYELLLRLTRERPGSDMIHVPLIGCSRPLDNEPKPDPTDLRRALQVRWADRPGVEVSAGLRPDWLRLRRPLPTPAPRVSIIVPTRDGGDHLRVCVDSLLQLTDYPDYELVLVDNQSRQRATLDYLQDRARDPRVRLMHFDSAFNFSAICNQAAVQASGEVLLLLNDDTQVLHADWLREMVSLAVRTQVGAVGAKLYFPDRTLQHGGVGLGIGGVAGHLHWGAPQHDDGYLGRLKAVQSVGAVTGACLAVSRHKFLAVGGMDAEHLRVALNDIDLCLKLAERGWRCVWTPYAELLHHESKSRGRDTTPEKRALFAREHAVMRQRWLHRLDADPYYHPWLTRQYLDLRLADTPPVHAPWLDDPPFAAAGGQVQVQEQEQERSA